MIRDSAGAKIGIVVGIGAVAIGIVALRGRPAAPAQVPTREPDRLGVATAPTPDPGKRSPDAEEKPAPPRGPTQADRVALFEAASEGDLARVEALFARGVNLDGTLANAAKSGNAALVGWLISHGVSPKEDDDLSVPPLLLADEHAAVVSLLLAKGAHEPTLAKAVAAAAPRAVVRLLAKGASATSKSADGEPVIMIAVRDGAGAKRRIIVDALLGAGADPSTKYDDETPLSLAITAAALHAENEETKTGDRPIDLVAKLLAKGAKVNGEALVAAMNANESARGALLDTLLAGSLERSATVRGVAHAADNHDAASVKKLAAKGIAWSTLEAHATPPLANAIVGSDVAMVKTLLEAGAPTDRMGEDGDSALLTAVAAAAGESDDALRVVRVLLEHGSNPNKRGRDGRTALFAAAQQGSEALVTLLVSKGARVDDPVDGMTPMEVADARGYDSVVKLLKTRGAKKRRVAED